MAEQGLAQSGSAKDEEDSDTKVQRVQEVLKDKLDHKEELVPKEGKGKYNITVPVVFEFLNRQKTKKTIREQKLESSLKDAKDKETEERGFKFQANSIPRSTREPLYKKIIENNASRRQEMKSMSIAMTKQNEKPFSFHQRDQEKAIQELGGNALADNIVFAPFKAGIIPWRVRAPLY